MRAAPSFTNIDFILLAAGRSERFGGAKLYHPFKGKPLIHHAAETFAKFPFARKWVTASAATPDISALGYRAIMIDGERPLIGDSIAQGVHAATQFAPRAIMIGLADMPCISGAHISALVAAFDGQRIATGGGNSAMPPAIFGPDYYADLMSLTGDQGAKLLLTDAPLLAEDAALLADIDTPADIHRLEQTSAQNR